MSDPLSIAASVAGLLAFTGTVSKSVFQFVTSIKDAPEDARNLVRSLYTLNIALGQIQQNLLDPDFALETNDKDVEDLQQCLANCTIVFTQLRQKVDDCGMGAQGQNHVRKAWESVKWSFTDDVLEDLFRRIEAEKATLQLLISAFTAKVTTGLLRYAKQTEARTRHMSRQLKDITITLQWLLPRIPDNERQVAPITSVEQRAVESSVFAASSAYNADELANLLRSSGSSLSLALDTSNDDTASVLWQPETERSLEPRASFSRASIGPPPQDQSGRHRNTDKSLSPIATSAILQVQKTRRSWLQKAPALPFDGFRFAALVIDMVQMASYCSEMISIAGKTSSPLVYELQDMATRAGSLSGLLQFMNDAGGEDPGLHDAWNSAKESVREYCDLINRAFGRSKKETVMMNLLSAGQESEREPLRQAAIRSIENVHMLAHVSFMKGTMRSQEHQGQQLDAIMGHMSAQFEMLRADLGHLTRPAPIAIRSLGDQEADAHQIPKTDGEPRAYATTTEQEALASQAEIEP